MHLGLPDYYRYKPVGVAAILQKFNVLPSITKSVSGPKVYGKVTNLTKSLRKRALTNTTSLNPPHTVSPYFRDQIHNYVHVLDEDNYIIIPLNLRSL